MPMLPKNVSRADQYLKYQREISTHDGTYNRTDRSRFFISIDKGLIIQMKPMKMMQ